MADSVRLSNIKKMNRQGAKAPRILLGLLWLACLFVSPVVHALEIGTSLVWWQYEEIASNPRYIGTPFHSKASTLTLAITTSNMVEINDVWAWRYEVSSLIPTAQTTESWPRSDYLQTNDLRIGQLEGQLTVMRRFQGFNVGLWGALRWHQQARQRFRKNGALLPDGLVTETVRTAWLGGSLSGQYWRLSAALPAWVRTTNSSISNVFSKRTGFRVGTEIHWPLTTWLQRMITLHGAYHFQQLGGDAQASALWPKNRFQTLSLGLATAW